MFEAIHGSAPDIAGRGIANPSGLLNGAIMMLVHIGQGDVAATVHNAWLKTIEDGIHTGDIYQEGVSQERVGTKGFADAIIERLGQTPVHFKTISYAAAPKPIHITSGGEIHQQKALVGVDIFLDWTEGTSQELGDAISALENSPLQLRMITNRGVKVYPDGVPETFCTDHWRCRFVCQSDGKAAIDKKSIWQQLALLNENGYDTIKTENLYTFDGQPGYSQIQGE